MNKSFWERWTDFVEQTKMSDQLAALYLFVLGRAKSITKLKEKHQAFPANCRLPAEEFARLKDLWRLLNKPANDLLDENIIRRAVESKTLLSLYVQKLEQVIPQANIHVANVLFDSTLTVRNYVWVTIMADCLGQKRKIEIAVKYDDSTGEVTDSFQLRLPICERSDFTEEQLYELLRRLKGKEEGFQFTTDFGSSLYLFFDVKVSGLREYVIVEKYNSTLDGLPPIMLWLNNKHVPIVVEQLNRVAQEQTLPFRNFAVIEADSAE